MRPELACAIELRRIFCQQALELRQPAIDRREIRPLVVVAGHDGVQRQGLPAQIVGGAERREGALECRAAALRLDEDPRAADPVFEPRIGCAHARRQRLDPVGYGLGTALTCPLERVGVNQRAHRLPLARVAEQRQRIAHLPALGEKLGRALGHLLPLGAGKALAHLFEQKLAKQRVVVVARLRAAAPIREQMAAIQVVEQSRRILAAGEGDRLGLRDRRRNRGQHQHALVLGFCAGEYLAREILEDRVLAFAERLVERRATAAQVLAQKHQRCDPPVALALDALQVFAVELMGAEYRLGFFGRAAQRRRVDARDPEARDQPREFRRRISARYDN